MFDDGDLDPVLVLGIEEHAVVAAVDALLNRLTGVNMPRPSGTQTRTFNYTGAYLTSATNPETGTVTYSYTNGLLMSKTDAKGQQIQYSCDDTYHRVTQVRHYPVSGGTEDTCQQVNFTYDSNSVPGFSYLAGRLATRSYSTCAVPFSNTGSTLRTDFVDMYSYTQAGQVAVKRLRVKRGTGQYDRPSNPSANNTEKFATYYQDQDTGLDYAMNRYYNSTSGRFLTPDPYRASGRFGDPGTWNRYAYVGGNPVGFFDPSGTNQAAPDEYSGPGVLYYLTIMIAWTNEGPVGTVSSGSMTTSQGTAASSGAFGSGSSQNQMRDAAETALDDLGPGCKDLFSYWGTSNTGIASLKAKAWSDQYVNEADVANASVTSFLPMETGTVQQYMDDHGLAFTAQWLYPETYSSIPPPKNNNNSGLLYIGNVIVINPRVFDPNMSQKFRDELMVHEILHTYTGQGDLELARTLTGKSFSDPVVAGKAIDAFLENDCKKKF